LDGKRIPTITNKKPTKQTIGAILMRFALKISGSKASGDEDGPAISINPRIITNIAIPIIIKLVLPNAKFL
jgi:hypothetical protein